MAFAASLATYAAINLRAFFARRGNLVSAENRNYGYRSHDEPAITVQNVSVGDGGKAIVGNVTQHASVIVSDKKTASAARKAPKTSGSRRRRAPTDPKRAAEA